MRNICLTHIIPFDQITIIKSITLFILKLSVIFSSILLHHLYAFKIKCDSGTKTIKFLQSASKFNVVLKLTKVYNSAQI
jgi:hypothetical protein